MNKTVCIVGVLDKPESTNVSMARAFQKLGYKVIPINYRTVLKQYTQVYLQNLLIHVIEKYNPFLIIFCKCNGVNPEIVKACTQHTKTWLWNPDPYQTIERCLEVIQHARYSTYSSCTFKSVSEQFKDQGVKNCYHILDGVDENIFKPYNTEEQYKADISFIGSKTGIRDKYKKALQDAGYNTKFYGPGYLKGVYNEEFAKVCSSSKYMLSINTYLDTADGTSNRLFRYLSCNSCVFHVDTTDTLKNYFKDKEELIIIKNENELVQKMHKLTDQDIKRISKAGRDRVLKDYTWKQSMKNILDIVEG